MKISLLAMKARKGFLSKGKVGVFIASSTALNTKGTFFQTERKWY